MNGLDYRSKLLSDAIGLVDEQLGDGYAQANPVLLAAFINGDLSRPSSSLEIDVTDMPYVYGRDYSDQLSSFVNLFDDLVIVLRGIRDTMMNEK